MSLLCVNDNEIQLKRRNIQKKPIKVLRTQYLISKKDDDQTPKSAANTVPQNDRARVDVQKEEMKISIERLIRQKTKLQLNMSKQNAKITNIIQKAGQSSKTNTKIDNTILALRKSVMDLKHHKDSQISASSIFLPHSSTSQNRYDSNNAQFNRSQSYITASSPRKQPQSSHNSIVNIYDMIDFSNQSTNTLLHSALERVNNSFRQTIARIKKLDQQIDAPISSSQLARSSNIDNRGVNQPDYSDEDGSKYYDFETRLNVNQACVSVMREANKMISLVKHSVAYKEILSHQEDDMQRKVESLINQNKALIEQNQEFSQKLVKTRKELNEYKNKLTAIRAIQAIGGGDFDFLKSQIQRIDTMNVQDNSINQSYLSEQQLKVTKQLDFGTQSNKKQLQQDSFIKISQQNGKPVKLYPLSTSSPNKYSNKKHNYVAATSQSFSQQSEEQNMLQRNKTQSKQQFYNQNSKFGLLETNLILQLNQIYQNKLNSMISSIESIVGQITFFTKISTKKKKQFSSTHTSEGIAKKIVDLGSSQTSFESMSEGGEADYLVKEEIDNDIQTLQNSSGQHHTIILDQPLRSSIQLTIKRIIQVRKMTEHQFQILKQQLHNRILSQNDAKHVQRYKQRIQSLKNELFNSKQIMQEARKEINQLAFGKAAILTGMSKPQDDDLNSREQIMNVLDQNIQSIQNKIQFESQQMRLNTQQQTQKPRLIIENVDYQPQQQQNQYEFPDFPTSQQILQQSTNNNNNNNLQYQDENQLQPDATNILDGTLQSSALQSSIQRADTIVLKNQYDRLRQKYIQLNIQYTKLHSALTSPSGGIQQLKSPQVFNNTSTSQLNPISTNYLSLGVLNNDQQHNQITLQDINQNEEKSAERLLQQNQQLRYLLQSNTEQMQFQKNQWERMMMEKRDQYLKDVRIQKEQIRYLKQELESYQQSSQAQN